MKEIRYWFWILVVFACGANASNNLSRLIETNPHWEASWFKFYISLVAVVVFGLLAKNDK